MHVWRNVEVKEEPSSQHSRIVWRSDPQDLYYVLNHYQMIIAVGWLMDEEQLCDMLV